MKTRFTLTRLPILLGILLLGVLLSGAVASRTQAAPLGVISELQVLGAGTGNGTMIDIVPGGMINCTSTAGTESGDCDESGFIPNFAVVASPSSGSVFSGWSGCDSTSTTTLPDDTCHISVMGTEELITATFTADFTTCASQSYIPEAECDALLALYSSTAGPGWTDSTGWLNAPDPCTWYGVTCTTGHVTTLNLVDNNLIGSLPAALGNLTSLQMLDLSNNQLSGSIPPELGGLTNMYRLSLPSNQLTGSIPPALGGLTSLQYLHLHNNQLSGSIPSELGDLTFLQYLILRNNQLTGSIPAALGGLTNLRLIDLSNNQLSGSIPPELGDLPNITQLYLDQNQLSGSIPPELGGLTNLEYLYLRDNQLSGSIPPELGGLTSLQYLHLSDNQLSGSIPPELGGLTSLQYLYLNINQLTGSIPPELGGLTSLKLIALNLNQLTGSIPPELGGMTSLELLDLSYNQLTGSIPPELGGLTSLTQIQLGFNPLLHGPLPLSLSSLTLLDYFFYNNTNLCEPDDPTFQAWLTAIPFRVGTGVTCVCNTLALSHTGSGTDPAASPTNSVGCSAGQYFFGEPISLSGAVPDPSWFISGWAGTDNDSSTAAANTLTMPPSAHAAGVDYSPICYTLTLSHTGNGSDPIASPTNSATCGAGEYVAGEAIDLTAVPDPGWVVSGWSGTDDDTSTSTNNSLTMPAMAHAASVNYIFPPGVGTYDDRYSDISYTGSWSLASFSGPYAGTFTESNTTGSTASFTFDGEGVTLVYTGYTTRGTIDIYIDAGYVTTLDQYRSGLNWQQEWTSGALGAGVHTISFEHVGGPTVDIDALIVTGPPPPPTCWALTLTHTGSGSDPVASPTNSTGCSAGYYYVGETIFLSGASPDSGWAISSWTGTDTDASTGATNIVTMPDSAHAAAVNYVEPPGVGTYDDRYAGISYSGSWVQINMGGPYLGTLTISSAVENSGLFTFDGEGIKVVYLAYSDGGYLNVEIDGGVVSDSIDMYSPSLLWQQEWLSGPLSPGVHTISFENDSGASVYVDAFIVTGPPPCHALTVNHTGNGATPTASPTNSTGCPVGEYHPGEVISLSGAAADPGWVISGWTGTDNDASTGVTNTVTMPDSIHTAEVNYVQPPGVGTYDDRYSGINYSGIWTQINMGGPYAGTLTNSATVGNSSSFTFDGEGITLVYLAYSNGTMDISIDGVPVDIIDTSSPTPMWQQEWSSGPLAAGVHTIAFEHTNGANVYVDAFIVTGPPPCYTLTLTYTGNGTTPTALPTSSTGCPVGEYHPGEVISLSGAAADPGWVISGWTGTDNDASTAATNTVTMPDSIHAAGVNYVQPPGVGTYDDRYAGINYSGGWVQINMGGPYLGTLTNSTTVGNSGSFTFDGEGITLVYTAYSSGTIGASIDGGPVGIIDTSNPFPLWQQEWSSGPLAAGVHTIIFTHGSGANVYVDAFIVTGPPPPPTCWALTLTHNGAGSDPVASPTNSTGCSAGEYYVGETISLSGASPDPFWVISSWTGTDDDASTADANVVTMPDSAHAAAVNYVVPPGTGTYDDRDAGIIYSGSWSQANYSGPYLGTITQSNVIGSTVSFAFIGDSITIKYTGYTTRGTVDIFIDGGYVTTFDQSYPGLLWQAEYSIGSLGYGAHTITFVHATGATMGIDALIVP